MTPEPARSDTLRRVVFDLTTSAQWGRPTVGVIQTERQLGRHAPDVVDGLVEYSVYDSSRNSFHRLRPDVAAAILDGAMTLRLRSSSGAQRSLRDRVRRLVSGSSARAATTARRSAVSLDEASDEMIELSPSDVVVSCGADWEGKDLAAIAAVKKRRGFRYASVCYDLIPWKRPDYWPPGVAETVVSHYARLARVADIVMCISRATARDYGELCDALGLATPRTAVFRLGDVATTSPDPRLPDGLEAQRYVLCVGSLEPRKNHRLLFAIWEQLARDATLPLDVKLVCAAGARWMTDELLLEVETNETVRDRIVIVEDVSDGSLQALYSSSLFTVYPSLDEGWGLPVAESLSHGKVCIASNRGGLTEISDLTVLLDPYDGDAWRDAIVRYATEERTRLELERRIRAEFEPTTWNESARSFFEAVLAVA